MEKKKSFLPVNWIDGMKINKNHFISTDNNVSMQISRVYSSFLNPYNYGLALRSETNSEPVKINIAIDSQGYVTVKILNCTAITRGGYRIEINESNYLNNEFSVGIPQFTINKENAVGKEYFICLAVNFFERVPFGIPEPNETPPRLPHVLPGYHLSVHGIEEKNTILTSNSLIIGKLIFIDGKPEIDENFIPACQTIYSHPKLIEYHAKLIKILGQIEIDVVDIIHAIKNKKQETNIAETSGEVADAVLAFLGTHMVEFKNMARYYPPVFIFEKVAALARTINNAIKKQSTAEKEVLFNYIQDWNSISQAELEKLLTDATELSYNHDDINMSVQKFETFLNVISKIFNTLSNLDFIGKKKDRQIFVKEHKEKPGNSFLVD
jgi:hypothetical protein